MGKAKPQAAAALERDRKGVEPNLGAERNRLDGHIRQSVQPDDRPQDRAGIAARLEGVDPPTMGSACEQLGVLPGMGADIKVGAWYHTGEFPDQRRDSSGLSLADPASNGMPARHGSNFGAYLVMNKMVWRRPDTATQGLAAFLRLGYAPPDRNLFSFEVDAGLTFKGLFPNRELDVLGLGAAYGRIGYARRLDQDQVVFTGIGQPIRDYEGVLEITYQARIAPWWLLQPDLQLVCNPGGYVQAPPLAPVRQPIRNALVIGLRSGITF